MCTVSWLREPGGYHLLCNRDEKHTRAKAQPPEIYQNYISPTDGDHGGSWISVNEHGVAFCLLNSGVSRNACVSRGQLIRHLAPARHIGAIDPTPYAPFILLMLQPAAPA